MKLWRKTVAFALVLSMAASMAACAGPSNSQAPSSSAPQTSSTAPESSKAVDSSEAVSSTPAETGTDDTPRNETLYYGTGQWSTVIDMNPMSPNSNNSLAVSQDDMARVLVYETLYMFDQLNAKTYPLLADGDYTWNSDNTVLTVKINPAAKWSDGTAVTAEDVAYTFDSHVKYTSVIGVDYSQYIESVTAVDAQTVEFKAKKENYNMLKILEYLPKVYVMQKAYLQKLEKETGGAADGMKNATMFDAPYSGPYGPMINNDQKVVFKRNDSYWGQDASMWGKLPVPKYVVHNIYPDNNAMGVAFEAGQIDVNQQYMSEIQKTWEEKGLPISTYVDKPPYQVPATMPSAIFNMQREGLDQKAVRQAIAYAIDYDQINSAAMTGQSPSFADFPRTLFNPSDSQQGMILDKEKLAPLQWPGKDVERAKKLLDDAGIVDTNGDGNREYNGKELSFKCECPGGWSDWEAALSIVSTAGKEIGIQMETYYPEAPQWTQDTQTGNFDITMAGPGGGIAAPWTSAYQKLYGFGGNFPETMNFNQGRYYNARVDELLALIPNETDEQKLKEYWQELNEIYLDEIPSFALMYRPTYFHEVNESVWTGFPTEGDGSGIPPQVCSSGYGIAALYNISLVNP